MIFLLLSLAALAVVLALSPRRMTRDLKPIPVKVEDKRPPRRKTPL